MLTKKNILMEINNPLLEIKIGSQLKKRIQSGLLCVVMEVEDISEQYRNLN